MLKNHKPVSIQNQGLVELQKEIHINKVLDSIKRGEAMIKAIDNRLTTIEITETEAMVGDEKVVILQTAELDEGLVLSQEDLDSGALTLKQGYEAIAEMVDAKRNPTQA